MASSKLFIVFGLLFIVGTLGHSYLTNPISRGNQKQSNTGCRGPACLGPCDQPASSARTPVTVQRGQVLSMQWPRNNHAGGFIRFAWAPTTQSDSHTVFDNNVQQIVCHEVGGCKPDDASNPNGGDSNPADGSYLPCQTTITVPAHLTDGLWTLQWAWFGGAFALGDYYSCVDYQVSGGASGSAPTPTFIGGDYSNPNKQVCKFFNTDRLHKCVNEPCDNPVFTLYTQQVGTPYGISSTTTGTVTPSTTGPSTTGPSTTGPSTTGPSTTGPSTTGPSTTGVAKSSTTGPSTSAAVPVTTSTTSTNQGSTGNCAGVSRVSASTATIMSVNTWGTTYLATIQFTVSESVLPTWALQVSSSAAMGASTISTVYNAGTIQCQSSTPVQHTIIKPIASWAQNLSNGVTVGVQVMGTNPNKLSEAAVKSALSVVLYSS